MRRSYCRTTSMTSDTRFQRLLGMAISLGAGLWLSACGTLDSASSTLVGVLEPYKMEIVQGNVVTKEQVAALTKGLTRTQVMMVAGTPLVASAFHGDRWDYTFSLQRQGKAPQLRRISVFFTDDRMDRVESDALPTEADFVASLRKAVDLPASKPMQASSAQLAQFPGPAPKPAAVQPAPSTTNYPPLEP
jgi:outer membrane protein assembly factor BamE